MKRTGRRRRRERLSDPLALAQRDLRALRGDARDLLREILEKGRRGLCLLPVWRQIGWRLDAAGRPIAAARRDVAGRTVPSLTGWRCPTCGALAALGFDGQAALPCALARRWRELAVRRAQAGAQKRAARAGTLPAGGATSPASEAAPAPGDLEP